MFSFITFYTKWVVSNCSKKLYMTYSLLFGALGSCLGCLCPRPALRRGPESYIYIWWVGNEKDNLLLTRRERSVQTNYHLNASKCLLCTHFFHLFNDAIMMLSWGTKLNVLMQCCQLFFQVSDVTTRLRGMQSHWVSLPNVLCSDRAAYGAGAEDKCWNGINRARWGDRNSLKELS